MKPVITCVFYSQQYSDIIMKSAAFKKVRSSPWQLWSVITIGIFNSAIQYLHCDMQFWHWNILFCHSTVALWSVKRKWGTVPHFLLEVWYSNVQFWHWDILFCYSIVALWNVIFKCAVLTLEYSVPTLNYEVMTSYSAWHSVTRFWTNRGGLGITPDDTIIYFANSNSRVTFVCSYMLVVVLPYLPWYSIRGKLSFWFSKPKMNERNDGSGNPFLSFSPPYRAIFLFALYPTWESVHRLKILQRTPLFSQRKGFSLKDIPVRAKTFI